MPKKWAAESIDYHSTKIEENEDTEMFGDGNYTYTDSDDGHGFLLVWNASDIDTVFKLASIMGSMITGRFIDK